MNMQGFCSFHWINTMLLKRWQHYAHTGWPKNVSHYQELSLNCTENWQCGYICHQFEYKMSTRML